MDRTILLEYESDDPIRTENFWTTSCGPLSSQALCDSLNGFPAPSEFRSYLGHNQVWSTKVIRMHVIVTGHLWPSVFDGDKNVTW